MISNQVMELAPHYLDDGPETESLGIDADQAVGDFVVFFPSVKVEVIRCGVLVTESSGGGTTEAEFKFDLRPTAGSDTDRGDGDVGHIKLAGKEAGALVYDEDEATTVIEPGEEVVFQMTQRADGTNSAGHVRPFLLVQPVAEEAGNLSGMVETA